MKIFDRLTQEQKNKIGRNTADFFIGSPEAEGESSMNSRIRLNEVFEDFLDVIPELKTEKFIITGRKGSGKSAIAENLDFHSNNDSTFFCDFVRKADIDIEKITQLSQESDSGVSQELLVEWIILTKLVKQLVSNELMSSRKGVNDLKLFLQKNSGFIDIKSSQIIEVIKSKGFDIQTEYLKRYVNGKYQNKLDIKSGKAPFYKLIPHLKETVQDLLTDKLNQHNSYLLIFDDLDIGFSAQNEGNIYSLLNILRVVKDYNINFFGKNGMEAKVLLLLRNDIARVLLTRDADTAKLFTSYEIPLRWYEHKKLVNNEDELKLKQFINKRIAWNFRKKGLEYDNDKPWESLIEGDIRDVKSSFKYVLDHTLNRPRDFILFFKPLSEMKFSIPIKRDDVNTLIGKYSVAFVGELKNELSAHYSPNEIDSVLKAFRNCVNNESITYDFFVDELDKFSFQRDPDELLELLFDLSFIGNGYDSGKLIFKYWEEDDQYFTFDKTSNIVLQFSLRNYCKRQKN